jgi:hypothetical protein
MTWLLDEAAPDSDAAHPNGQWRPGTGRNCGKQKRNEAALVDARPERGAARRASATAA